MTILAAVDEQAQNADVLPVAHDLATTYGDTLVVLHVVPDEEFEEHKEEIENIDEFGNFSVTQERQSAARFASRLVEETLEGTDGDAIEPRGRVGNPADEILAEADSIDPRYVVVGGRRRSPVGKALFGSATQEVLLNADAPVVTVMIG